MRYSTLLILLLLTSVACTSKKAAPKAEPPLQLAVATALEQEIPIRVEFSSKAAAATSYIIEPRITGYVNKIHFTGSQKVKKGDKLYSISPEEYSAGMLSAKAALASAKASLIEAQSNYKRSVPLAKINAISQSELDQATYSLRSAEEAVTSANANLQNAMLNLSYTNIYSPIDGVASTSIPSTGDLVGPASSYPTLTTISNVDSILVLLSLPTKKYEEIAELNPQPIGVSDIVLTTENGQIYPHKGRLKYIEPTINTTTGTVVMRVYFPNPEGALMPGQFVRVGANIGENQRALLLPAECVNTVQGTLSVFLVLPDSTLKFKEVTSSGNIDGMAIISSGIKDGDLVAATNFSKLNSGMKVAPTAYTTSNTAPKTVEETAPKAAQK